MMGKPKKFVIYNVETQDVYAEYIDASYAFSRLIYFGDIYGEDIVAIKCE